MFPDQTIYRETLAGTVPRFADFFALTKPGILFSVLLSTLAGYILSVPTGGSCSWPTAFHLLIGTAMVAGGAGALNMLLEQDSDQLMNRTRNRPLPSGHLSAGQVFLFGAVLSSFGAVHLCLSVGLLSGFFAACSLAVYLTLYTPLKKVTPHCTIVGAVSGAMPPLIGWSASPAAFDIRAISLFAILFLWQIPHLFALGWLYRADYARVGFKMLPVPDSSGKATAQMALISSLVLILVSAVPFFTGMAGPVYLFGAAALAVSLTVFCLRFGNEPSERSARNFFLATVVYLPLLLGMMIVDR